MSLYNHIAGINESRCKLDAMTRSLDYFPIQDEVSEMGWHFNGGLKVVKGDGELRELTNAYSRALDSLHNAVFVREKDSLHYQVSHFADCYPVTQRIDVRRDWDGAEDAWENPIFDSRRGFARLIGRKPPMEKYRYAINVDRYAKFSLVALAEETDDLSRMPLVAARDTLADFVDTATCYYARCRTGWYDIRAQISLVFLHAMTNAMEVCNTIGTGSRGLVMDRGFVGLHYEALFWFRMPELPSSGEIEGVERFVRESESEIKIWIDRLCAAQAHLFTRWLYQAAMCVEKCIVHIAESNKFKAAALLVLVITQIRNRLALGDLSEAMNDDLTIPIGDSSGYSLPNTICVMRRLAKNATRGRRHSVPSVLASKMRAITLEFSYALNFESYSRRELIAGYSECLSIIRAKAIAAI